MLSDSIRQMRILFNQGLTGTSTAGVDLTLRAYELEARNMEERILLLSGREHVPLDGMLVSQSTPVIEIGGKNVTS